MFKATIIFIFANHWLYQVDSLPNYIDESRCYESVGAHLARIPQEWLDLGLGVYDMQCTFIPMPLERPK